MKIIISLLVVAFMASQAVAGNGDLIVDGKLGVGSTATASRLHVGGSISAGGAPLDGTRMDMYSWAHHGLVLGENSQSFPGIALGGALRAWHGTLSFNNYYNEEGLSASSGALISATGDSANQADRGMHLDYYTRNSSNNSFSHVMRMSSGGNIGIGTSQPDVKLHLAGRGDAIIKLENSDNANTWWMRGNNASADFVVGNTSDLSDVNIKLYIRADGNVAIGTPYPQAYKLYVAGTAYSTGGWQGSDARFKKDLLPISTALEKVSNLNGLSYKWKTDEYRDKGFPEGRHYGVIAQEIEKVLPEVVSTAPDGTKAVAYTEIIPVLIEAIKEQQREIESLKKKVADLE